MIRTSYHRACFLSFLLLSMSLFAGCGPANRFASPGSRLADALPTSVSGHPNDLIQERYPDTVSLPEFMRQLKDRSRTIHFFDQLCFLLKNRLGIDIKGRMGKAEIFDHPEVLLDVLQFTPQQMAAGRNEVTSLSKKRLPLPGEEKLLPPLLRPTNQLPETFDFFEEDHLPIELMPTQPPAGSSVYLGFLRDANEDENQVRHNLIFSEVIERLSTNLAASGKHRFRVIYNGETYDRLDTFLAALRANDHQITAILRHYTAPFIPIFTRADDGRFKPVSATIFMKTGFYDPNGQEAILPTIHSELVFFVKPGEKTAGQAIDAAIQFYQGIPKMGFYGLNNTHITDYLGLKISDTFDNDEAYRALILGGYMVDLNRSIVQREHLILDGWAQVGVCNDSSAVVQMAIKGHVNSYPLAMVDAEYLGEIGRRLTDRSHPSNPVDTEVYLALKRSIELTPEDIGPDPTALRRVNTALPWEAGKEPFPSTVAARNILQELLAH